MRTIVWSIKALNDLDDIVTYIGSRNRPASLDLAERIAQAVLPAARFPYMFRKGRLRGSREIVAHPNYVIVYRVRRDMIIVTAVIHAMRQYP